MFMKVDLPLPEAPTTATNEPRSIARSTPAQRVHGDVAHHVGLAQVLDPDERPSVIAGAAGLKRWGWKGLLAPLGAGRALVAALPPRRP